jgi:hypothetical protein
MTSPLTLVAAEDADRCGVTPGSLAAAKAAQALERHRVQVETGVTIDEQGHFVLAPDPVRLGMQLGNFIAAACYGPRGQYR